MAGTREGALKQKAKRLAENPNYYKQMGSLGGKKSTTGGFGSNSVGSDGLTGSERARVAGAKGGLAGFGKPKKRNVQ